MAASNTNGSGNIGMISSIAGLIVMAASGIYFAEGHFLTHTTGVSRDVAEEKLVTKEELLAAQEANSAYLLDLRIEQATSRQRDLEDRAASRPLDDKERRRLDDVDKELQRLYNIKEKQR